MANNRFDTYLPNDYSFQVYQPQDFSPDFSSLDALLGGLQKEYDVGNSTLNRISPNYLRQSDSDTQAAKAFRQKYDGLIKQSTDAFASGNISEGRRLMSGALREVEKDQMPGGDYYELERRVGEYQGEAKRLNEFYKDNPKLAQYAIANKVGITPFRDPITGEANSIKAASDIYKDIPDAEIAKWFDGQLGNIKDTLLSQGFDKRKLDAITDVYDLKTLSGREFNDVAEILARNFPKDFVNSIKQRYQADRYYDPNLPDIDPTQIFETTVDANGNPTIATDDQGRIQFANTTVGNLLKGNSLAGTRRNVKDQLIKDDDELALENLKSSLRKKEIDYEFNLGNETLRTPVFTKGSGMPEWNFQVGENGQMKVEGEVKANQALNIVGGLGPTTSLGGTGSMFTGKKFKEYINSAEGQAKYPEMYELSQRFKGHVDKLDDKRASEFLEKKYNEKKSAMQTADAEYTVYNNPKQLKAKESTLLGEIQGKDGARIGNIRNKTLIVQQPGQEPKSYKLQDLLSKYDISVRDFITNTSILGNIRSDNPIVQSGEQLSYTRPDGTAINFIASDISQEDAQFKTPEFTLNLVRQNGTLDKSPSTYIGVPELDQQYGRVYAEAKDVYLSDVLARKMDNPNLRPDEYEDLVNQYSDLIDHPSKNTFISRDADLISVETGENLTESQGLTIDKIAQLKSTLTNGK